jgi:outer membrane protein assembly factor BamB
MIASISQETSKMKHPLLCGRAVLAFYVIASSAGLALSETGSSSNWSYWRGPSSQGYSDDTRVPLSWSETKNVLWKTKLPGAGNSSPIIWGDRIFLTAARGKGNQRLVLCLRKSDGKLLWERVASRGAEPGPTHKWNGYASSSCATDGKRVYAFFGTPGLFCYDLDGSLVWKKQFGILTSVWGTAASPFLYDDLVIVNLDNDGPRALPKGAKPDEVAPMALVALDKASGKMRWQTERDMGRGFSTPRCLRTADGRDELILNGPQGVWVYEPRTGKEIWHCDRLGDSARFGEPIPVCSKDTMFVPSGRPGPMQAIRLGGKGDVSGTHVLWTVRRKDRDVSSQMLYGDLLYAADRAGMLTCYDSKTGKVIYKERLTANGKSLASPLAVRGKLLWVMDNGETFVIEPGPKLKVVARNKLGDGSQLDFGASPAISDGCLFLRSQSQLYCIGAKK